MPLRYFILRFQFLIPAALLILDQLLARAVQLSSLPRLAHLRQQPHEVQARLLRGLLARARRTEWGRRYGFGERFRRPALPGACP